MTMPELTSYSLRHHYRDCTSSIVISKLRSVETSHPFSCYRRGISLCFGNARYCSKPHGRSLLPGIDLRPVLANADGAHGVTTENAC